MGREKHRMAASGHHVWASFSCLSELVDLYATVTFVNEQVTIKGKSKLSDALKALAVVTHVPPDARRPRHTVVLRTESGDLPDALKEKAVFSAPGSTYSVHMHTTPPPHCVYRVECNFPEPALGKETLDRAVRAAANLLNERVDPTSLLFRDIVASRVRMFKRKQIEEELSSAIAEHDRGGAYGRRPVCTVADVVCTPPPPHDPPRVDVFAKPASTRLEDLVHAFAGEFKGVASIPHRRPRVVPFAKPESTRLEDLLHAFATHGVDKSTGAIFRIGLLDTSQTAVRAGFLPQALVFCSRQSFHAVPMKS